MSSRRTAILIVAIAVGIVAVVLIWQYVRGIEDRINEDSKPVDVFIAAENIPRGTPGQTAVDAKQIQQAQIPQKFRPATAITSTDQVQQKVALFDISPGTVIVDKMFVDPSTSQISFRERLKNPQHVAISIQVDQVRGVGGFLVPGDEVNMMIMQDNAPTKSALEASAADPTAEQKQSPLLATKVIDEMKKTADQHIGASVVASGLQDAGPQWIFLDTTARYLYQKVQILAVGQSQLLSPGEQAATTTGSGTTTTPPPSGGGSGLLTINVPSQAAQLIASVADKGLYLTLVPRNYQPVALPPLPIIMEKLPGEDPAILCPYAKDTTGCNPVG